MEKTKSTKNFIFGENTESGVALLFAMLISGIILAIALGIISIAVKEVNFNTSAKNTNEAFFAADTGVECALYNDKSGSTPFTSQGGTVDCLSSGPNITPYPGSLPSSWIFVIAGLGNSSQACAQITVSKTFDNSIPTPVLLSTDIVSKGYNLGFDDGNAKCASSSNVNRVERVLEVKY